MTIFIFLLNVFHQIKTISGIELKYSTPYCTTEVVTFADELTVHLLAFPVCISTD